MGAIFDVVVVPEKIKGECLTLDDDDPTIFYRNFKNHKCFGNRKKDLSNGVGSICLSQLVKK